jgi:hypothetical protein
MSRSNSNRFGFVVVTGVATLLAAGGCSMPKASDFKPSKLFSLGDDDEPEKGIPVRMVGTWTDTVLSQAGQKSQRGFGGRLMFYGKKEDKPILVEGQLVVYAFDETNRAVTDNKPTRRYVFPPDEVARRMSKSELGAGYSFWLPWDEVGGPQTEVSLACRFESKGGGVITSEQTRHRLPGTMAAPAMTADGRPLPPKLPEGVPSRPAQPTLESMQASRIYDPNLQQAGYTAPAMNNLAAMNSTPVTPAVQLDPHQQMTTTTIPLPANYRLAMGTAIAGPAPQQPAAPPQQLTQPQLQAYPIQQQPLQQQPVVNPMVPAQQQVPAATMNTAPGFYPAMQNPRLGAFPAPIPRAPTVASPAVHLPSANGFGFGAAAPLQPQPAVQPTTGQPAQIAGARMIPWNNVQTTTAQQVPGYFAQQQQAAGAPQSPQIITQPAAQPLPPAGGLTTTVSYPTPATALR